MPDTKYNQGDRGGGRQRNDKRAESSSVGGGDRQQKTGPGGGSFFNPGKRDSSGLGQRGAGGGDPGRHMDDRNRRGGAMDASRHGDGGEDDIEIIEPTKKKYTGRCRLFVGNLPMDMKEVDLRKHFEPYGSVAECFMSGKGFAFMRLDTRAHAEAAKEALDGQLANNRPMRIRFAVHGAAIRVKELSPYVSNELLYRAFSQFGTVERAVHVVDEKGRPTGEGIVEFERKPGALDALRRVGEGAFLLTSNPKPVIVEPLEPRDEDDGQPERMIPRNAQMTRELQESPRFALPGTFEHEFGNRWKELFQMEKARREQLEAEFREGRERLEADMDVAFQDYQAMLMREDLRRRQEELDRLEAAKRERVEMMRRREEERASRRPDMGPFGQGFHGYFGREEERGGRGFGQPFTGYQGREEERPAGPGRRGPPTDTRFNPDFPPFSGPPPPIQQDQSHGPIMSNERGAGGEGGRAGPPGGPPPPMFGIVAGEQQLQGPGIPDMFQNQPPMQMFADPSGAGDFQSQDFQPPTQNKRRRYRE